MSNARWWAVYRDGEHIVRVLAASGEKALDAVSEMLKIPLEELNAVDHDAIEQSGLGLLPMMSPEIGPEFSDAGPTDADLRGEVDHGP